MMRLCYILFIMVLSFLSFSCKDDVVTYDTEVDISCCKEHNDCSKVNHHEKHTIHFSLPSKYKKINENYVPSLYADIVYVDFRDIIDNIYIGDTLSENWLYYGNGYKDSIPENRFFDMIEYYMSNRYCSCSQNSKMYDLIEDSLQNGNKKYVFISFCQGKRSVMPNFKNELGVNLYIVCLIKTIDDFCIEFRIRSFEPLAEFNYQEKMDIINSIYVE